MAGLMTCVAGPLLAACGADPVLYERAFTSDDAPWLNGAPLRATDLQGKVVLVNFWTYTCINSLRPLPYVRLWWESYAERGLVVVGVHAPEFSFEQELPRVRQAVADHGIRYPVVLDNQFRIWRAFENGAWPAFYLLDAKGELRHRQLGEGGYADLERRIQGLLAEARGDAILDPSRAVQGRGEEAAPDWANLRTPETYVGYAKATDFVSRNRLRRDAPADYQGSDPLPLNGWTLAGRWNVQQECAEAAGAARIAFRFHARDLHLVMGPGREPTPFTVRIDGSAPGADHGTDIDDQGRGLLREARLYQLVRQEGRVRDRTCEIAFDAAGPRAYCFTFG